MFYWIRQTGTFLWRTGSLIVLLSIVATIPILQFASFGYMLEVASRIAGGKPMRSCFPGTEIAGRLLVILACVSVSWLPVWFIADMAYNAELIEQGSAASGRLRIAARCWASLLISGLASLSIALLKTVLITRLVSG